MKKVESKELELLKESYKKLFFKYKTIEENKRLELDVSKNESKTTSNGDSKIDSIGLINSNTIQKNPKKTLRNNFCV